MQSLDGKLIFSATDLSNFLACPHLTLLSRRTALGGPKPRQFPDPGIEVLRQRGREHEQKFLAGLRDGGQRRVADLTRTSEEPPGLNRYERYSKTTTEAMRAGNDVIYQGCLFDGSWLGYPDFLVRVDRPSALGAWSYEVVDTKLAREAKGGALLQILLYADLLEKVQGTAPASVHLALGGPESPLVSFRVRDYAAYFRSIKKRFLEWVAAAPGVLPLAAEPVAHCEICDWNSTCTKERRDVDHLSFVAGITRQQRRALVAGGVTTLEALGDLNIGGTRIVDITPAALTRVHSQARIQLQGRRQGKSIHELLQPVVQDQGLAALPEPSPGDLFLDLEGDPYAFELGIEYLFGVADVGGVYSPRWSLDRATERQTFEWFMDLVTKRLEQFPNLHIYHYAAYEPTALKRLAGRFDSRIDELDRLLRGKVLVDLYRVVRQGLRASVESYSIKKMEAFYQFERQVDLRQATGALADFEAWLQLGGTRDSGGDLLQKIEGYNKDDCLSTLKLREWLETLRRPDVPRPSTPAAEPPEELSEKLHEVRAVMTQLLDRVPEDPLQRTADQQGRWLLAQMLEYHRRENKSMWWRYFNWLEMNDEENPLFTLPMYYPLHWYRGPDKSIDALEEGRQKQVVGLIRTQFLKRFESSVAAFELSCERLLKKLLAFLEVHGTTDAEKRRLERWKAQNGEILGYATQRHLDFWSEPSEEPEDEDVVPQEMLDAVERLDPKDYDVVEMMSETFLDLEQIVNFLEEARKFEPKHDDKLQKLVRLLKTKELAGQKVLMFTEFADTARYLKRQLDKAGVDGVAQVDSGTKRNRADVIQSFSPYYNGTSSRELTEKGREEIRVLVSTDVLSEGLNLQDASRMINYDIHWNPVRLMQRIGRVDRRMNPEIEKRLVADHPKVEASRGKVSFWNFLPPEELNAILTLYTRVTQKTLLISRTLGIEGKKLLTPEDDYEALKEFNQAYEGTKTAVEGMHLEYQAMLQADPTLDGRLKRLPGSTFSGRKRAAKGARGVFFCYALPALDKERNEFTEDAGTTRWYLYDLDRDTILEEPAEITGSVRSTPDTLRQCTTDRMILVDLRTKVEKHIKNTYLKRVDAPVGVRPTLKCWMELNEG